MWKNIYLFFFLSQLFNLEAKQNNSDALTNLGNIYSDKKDIDKAIYLLEKTLFSLKIIINCFLRIHFTLDANLNNPNAYHNLGTIYNENNDIENAIYYYQLAVDHNIVASMHDLGMIYADGKNGKVDSQKAIYYLSKAADKKDIRSIFDFGCIKKQSIT